MYFFINYFSRYSRRSEAVFYPWVKDTEIRDGLTLEEIIKESGAKYLEFELWNSEDKARVIFEEAGYDMTDGNWEYSC